MQTTEEKTSPLEKLKAKKEKIKFKEKVLKKKDQQRKKSRFIQIGTLAARHEIDHFDDPTLSGAFAKIKELSQDPEVVKQWKQHGERLAKVDRLPLIISFEKEPSEEVKKALKNSHFRWVSFRQEWHGYGIKEELEKLVLQHGGKVEVVGN
ncbi:MAG TPA: hypothetical protein VHA52_01770 [Candidatus Babeliaceae bacterium]|nr:hypothetical protein [Candidatus Babeliaceae bacterium]